MGFFPERRAVLGGTPRTRADLHCNAKVLHSPIVQVPHIVAGCLLHASGDVGHAVNLNCGIDARSPLFALEDDLGVFQHGSGLSS